MTPVSPNLRHRRNKQDDENTQNENEEIKPLLEKTLEPSQKVDKEDATGGYKLEPLVERSIWMRLDVAPFLLFYAILIGLDLVERDKSRYFDPFNVLFPLILVGQLVLFFLQQWNIQTRAMVGFQPAKSIESMTHCLVEAPHVDKHQSAHDDGIVVANRSEDGAVIVKFRDVVFRSHVCSTGEDVDATLWKKDCSSGNSTQTISRRTFHRLRYPIHLPLDFYRKWQGHNSLPTLVQAQGIYGSNTTPIDLPPFLALLQEQVVAPFFLFQVLCVVLWSLDECKFCCSKACDLDS